MLIMIFVMILCLSISVYADGTCTGIFGQKLIDEINDIFKIIQIAAPILLLFLTSFDFAKVIFSDNKDGLNKAKNNFLKRAVAVLIIFFAPFIIRFILNLVNETTMNACLEQIK